MKATRPVHASREGLRRLPPALPSTPARAHPPAQFLLFAVYLRVRARRLAVKLRKLPGQGLPTSAGELMSRRMQRKALAATLATLQTTVPDRGDAGVQPQHLRDAARELMALVDASVRATPSVGAPSALLA